MALKLERRFYRSVGRIQDRSLMLAAFGGEGDRYEIRHQASGLVRLD